MEEGSPQPGTGHPRPASGLTGPVTHPDGETELPDGATRHAQRGQPQHSVTFDISGGNISTSNANWNRHNRQLYNTGVVLINFEKLRLELEGFSIYMIYITFNMIVNNHINLYIIEGTNNIFIISLDGLFRFYTDMTDIILYYCIIR